MPSPLLFTIAIVVAVGLGAVLVLFAVYRMAIQERFDAKAVCCLLVGAALAAAPLILRPEKRPVVQDRSDELRRLESELQATSDAKRTAEAAAHDASVSSEALRQENASLRARLDATRKELETEREEPSVAAQPIAPQRSPRRRTTRRRPTPVRQPARPPLGPDWVD